MALTSLRSTGRGGQEQPGVKTRNDVKAVSREYQEKQLWNSVYRRPCWPSSYVGDSSCELFPGWALGDAGQAPLNSLHHVIPLTLGLPARVGTGRVLGGIKDIGS